MRSADESKAHLVSIVGIAGIGKSRLAWELQKYFDGVAQAVQWHRGRCLAYGEGVSYWALAEMVRMRAGIAEGEEPESARAKLRSALEQYVDDPEEREWIEPRLAQLLALEAPGEGDRADLFAGWRLFLERLADRDPVVLVFEDMQWADAPLLEFLEYLLDWSRSHRLFVLALARPELGERHPGWGARATRRPSRSSRLRKRRCDELLEGFVPGLPDDIGRQVLDRAEGVPLYAVETVRMLLDRGLLEQQGSRYRPTGSIAALEVPETLHALVAARLDGLTDDERRLVQDASVVGKTFTREHARRRREPPGGRRRPAPHRSHAQGVPLAPGRPTLSRARPVRLPPGSAAARSRTRRCPGASARPASRRRAAHLEQEWPEAEQEIGRDRRVRTTSPRSSSTRAPTDAAEIGSQGTDDAGQGGRPSRVSCGNRERSALLRAGARARETARSTARSSTSARAGWRCSVRVPRQRAPHFEQAIAGLRGTRPHASVGARHGPGSES